MLRGQTRRIAVLITLILVAIGLTTLPDEDAAAGARCRGRGYKLKVSRESDRSAAVRLCGKSVSGDIYVFLAPGRGIERVRFLVDGRNHRVEQNRPWDLAGGDVTSAYPFDTTDLVDGKHVVVARVVERDGNVVRVKSRFRVENEPVDDPPSPGSCADGVRVPAGKGTLNRSAEEAPPGTTFCLEAGTFMLTSSVVAERGDRFVGGGRTATFVVGDGTVRNLFVGGPNAHFTVASFDISGATGASGCAPDCGRAFKPSSGIALRDVRCHHNANQCIGGGGGNTVIVESEIDHNGLDQAFHGVSAAGVKRVSGEVAIRNSYIHDNGGNGVWCDECDGDAFIVEGNRIIGNARKGLNFEVSGRSGGGTVAIIRNNVIQGNNTEGLSTAAGIAIISSRDVEIHDNVFGGNGDGRAIIVFKDGRGFPIDNISIHDNTLNGDVIEGCKLSGVTCSRNE